VIEIILEKKISGGPVLNEKRELVGMLSEKDCLKLLIDEAYHDQHHVKKTVADYMTKDVATVSVDMDVLDVANEFLRNHFRRFPVVENGVLRGQVSRRDILKAARDIKITSW
jgi:CBS domain-containing protein